MFLLYLRRELGMRKRQTAVVASGLAIAIGLAVVVQAASAGVSEAQASALQSMYGIGTDVAITKSGAEQFGGQRFEIGGQQGRTQDQTRTFSRSRLRVMPGSDTLTATDLTTVRAVPGVATATGTLRLNSVTFNGQLPTFNFQQNGSQGANQQGLLAPQGGQSSAQQGQLAPMPSQSGGGATGGTASSAPQGGFDGRGGSAFDITTFSVEGVDPTITTVGPLTTTRLVQGRLLNSSDANSAVAVVDEAYATSAKLAVNDTVTVADTTVKIVGIVTSTSTSGSTSSSNVYMPLDTAQKLSGVAGVTNIYVSAADAGSVAAVTTAIQSALPGATVNSSTNLADSITGSLATATSLVGNLGKWLSIIVLLAAFLIAMLLTSSGVQRRTREFGTLKALGWRSGRIVRQVIAESVVTGAIGGLFGLVIGGIGIWAVNNFAPTLSAAQTSSNPFLQRMQQFGQQSGQQGQAGGFGGRFGGMFQSLSNQSTDVALHASLTLGTVLLALGLALLGGIIAGAFGGLRASRLRPAAALRSVA